MFIIQMFDSSFTTLKLNRLHCHNSDGGASRETQQLPIPSHYSLFPRPTVFNKTEDEVFDVLRRMKWEWTSKDVAAWSDFNKINKHRARHTKQQTRALNYIRGVILVVRLGNKKWKSAVYLNRAWCALWVERVHDESVENNQPTFELLSFRHEVKTVDDVELMLHTSQ